MYKYPTQYARSIKLAEGTVRGLGNSPLQAGALVEAAAIANSLSHKPHCIQISQIPPNLSTPARTSSNFRKKTIFHVSRLSCIAPIPHPLTITSSREHQESPRDHYCAASAHADGRRRNSVLSHVPEP
jgi:hypothetical protein